MRRPADALANAETSALLPLLTHIHNSPFTPPPPHSPLTPNIPNRIPSRLVCALQPNWPRPLPLFASGTIAASQASGTTVSTTFSVATGAALAWADYVAVRLLPAAWEGSPTLVSEAIFYGATRYAGAELFGGGRAPCAVVPPSATPTPTPGLSPSRSSAPSPSSTPSAGAAAAAAAAAAATAEATKVAAGVSVAALLIGLALGVAVSRFGSISSWACTQRCARLPGKEVPPRTAQVQMNPVHPMLRGSANA